jgi:hypothetical protein
MVVPALKATMTPRIQTGNDVQWFIIGERLCSDEPGALRDVKQAKEGREDQACLCRANGFRARLLWRNLTLGVRVEVIQSVVGAGLDHFREPFSFIVRSSMVGTRVTASI